MYPDCTLLVPILYVRVLMIIDSTTHYSPSAPRLKSEKDDKVEDIQLRSSETSRKQEDHTGSN